MGKPVYLVKKLYTILVVNLLTNTLIYDGMGNRNLFG